MNANYIDSLIAKTASMIRRWRGRDGMMLDLSPSHSTLRLVLQGDNYDENLVVCCIEPEFICGPTKWTNTNIVVHSVKLSSSADGVAVSDEENGIRVIAESFEVKENVRL